MSWIALQMLTGDRAKFFGIVMGLTFAALLIMQQGSIFCGLMRRTAGQIIDILRGKRTAKVEQFGHDTLSVFGVGSDVGEGELRVGDRVRVVSGRAFRA